MSPYTIDRSSNSRRKAAEEKIWGLDLVSAALREPIVTAWVTTWSSSPYERLEDMPWTAGVDYPLLSHVNEVTRAGVDLAKRAKADWDMNVPNDVLIPALILHDVDKPLMYVREGGEVVGSKLSKEIPHGVVGAMLLKELGFSHEIISVVATHSPKMPFHNRGTAAYVLHYADMFSADHALMSFGKEPYLQKHIG
jgi:putative nucleotidyltransferase with HDIG domain